MESGHNSLHDRPRILKVKELVKPVKAPIIYGPRRVGKTTLVKGYKNATFSLINRDNYLDFVL